MKYVKTYYKEYFKHLIPGIIALLTVGIAVSISPVHTSDAKMPENIVVAETDISIEKKEKKEKKNKEAEIVGDIDLSKCNDGVYTGRGQGYAGYLEVEVTVKNKSIKKIILKQNQADDAPYVKKAKAVIPKVIEKQSLSVDTVSGATYSSNGILSAVEDALKQAMGEGSSYKEKKSSKKKQKSTPFFDGEYNDGKFLGSAKAYRGDISVAVTITTGKIKKIEITKTQDDEDYLIMARAVIPQIIKKQSPNVDTVSGATYSSKGIINASKNALKKAKKNGNKNKDGNNDNQDENNVKPPLIPDPGENGGEIVPLEILYVDGTHIGYGWGYHPRIQMSATVLVEKNKIIKIDIDHVDDDEYINPCINYMIPRIIQRQGTDGIDTVSGATWSSQGIIDAVNNALKDKIIKD